LEYIMAYVEVEVDLDQFDDDELIEEVKARGLYVDGISYSSKEEDLEVIYQLRRCGKSYDHLMDAYIYKVLGKVI
jgi:hypothetical protein